jgi:hypothetical protein
MHTHRMELDVMYAKAQRIHLADVHAQQERVSIYSYIL